MGTSPMLEEENWSCPICMSMLYKPTVASACGHIFCFWCCHKSMSPFSPSKCPLCRTSFGHFPDVCNLMHHCLLKAFPEQYEARAEETRHMEADEEVTSVEVAAPAVFAENERAQAVAAQDSRLSLADFLCARPGCAQLLREPVVLNCGCCVCLACRPPLDGQCPRCGAISVTTPVVCSKLKELLAQLFPEPEYRETCRAALQLISADQEGERAKRPKTEESPRDADQAQQPQSASTASTEPAEDDESRAAMQARLAAADTHYGIACDFCGQYPIIGDRWQCLDCPERVGFDLCAACYEKRADVVGRFNQHHKADHKMKQVHITPNFLHVLQAANPELDMPQILGMMQMAFDNEDPPIPHTHRGGPRPSYENHPLAPGNLAAAAMLAHGHMADEDDLSEAELLVHTQGPVPPFLLPGQLGDQIPMDVSTSRSHAGTASRQQQNDSSQSAQTARGTGAEQATEDIPELTASMVFSSDAGASISRPAVGTPSGDDQHAEIQGVAIGVTPEGSLLTVVISPSHAAQGTRQAGSSTGAEQGHQSAPGRQ